jgi:hypothetical protein
MKKNKIVILLFSDNDAGLPDLERFKRKYKKAIILNFYKKNFLVKLIGIFCLFQHTGSIFIHSQSEKWGILIKCFIPALHYQVCHVQKDFPFSSKFKYLHKIIYFLNRSLCFKKIFLSEHVAKNFNYRGKLIIFDKLLYRPKIKKVAPNFCFFFGRDEKYKNIDFFLEVASITPTKLFYVYSNNFKYRSVIPENVRIVSKHLSDEEVNLLFERNGLLILPYSYVAQSGPFYLGYENGLNIIVPSNEYFKKYSNVKGVFVMPNLDPNAWKKTILSLLR